MTNAVFGPSAYSGGGLVQVDWIEADITPPLSSYYRDEFTGTSLSAGWQPRGGSWSVGSGYLTGSFSVVGVDAQLTRTNAAGTPTTIRARILNTPGAPEGAASTVFNWVSPTQYYAIELRTANPTWSADIVSLGPGGTQVLATCPVGMVNTDTWYILELVDTPAGLVGRLLDGAGNPMACSMSVPGVHVTNAEFGVGVYSGGGLVQVDWIETDVTPPLTNYYREDFNGTSVPPGWQELWL